MSPVVTLSYLAHLGVEVFFFSVLVRFQNCSLQPNSQNIQRPKREMKAVNEIHTC
jgi:hypothetical protein